MGCQLNRIIRELFVEEFGEPTLTETIQISEQWKQDAGYGQALRRLEALEKDLEPIGIGWSRYENRTWSFKYPLAYDGMYRQLKYVYLRMRTSSPLRVAATRDIVYSSTAHVEACFKVFCRNKGIQGAERKSLSALARSYGTLLEDHLRRVLGVLGEAVANPAKHEFDLQGETSLFGVDDAFAVYLICKKVGYALIMAAGEADRLAKACENGPFLYPTLGV